jgi:hypothetical protein
MFLAPFADAPRSPAAFSLRGVVKRASGDAEECFRQARQRDPN